MTLHDLFRPILFNQTAERIIDLGGGPQINQVNPQMDVAVMLPMGDGHSHVIWRNRRILDVHMSEANRSLYIRYIDEPFTPPAATPAN